MDTLLSIMLYVQAIMPGQSYTASYINNVQMQQAPIISAVYNNPPQLQQAVAITQPLVPTITIVNDNNIIDTNPIEW